MVGISNIINTGVDRQTRISDDEMWTEIDIELTKECIDFLVKSILDSRELSTAPDVFVTVNEEITYK